jgi:hypothetical protein
MDSDWEFIMDEYIDYINQETIKILIGFNPKNNLQFIKIRKVLRINIRIIHIYEKKYGNSFKK